MFTLSYGGPGNVSTRLEDVLHAMARSACAAEAQTAASPVVMFRE
jgi:hypothetical protein